VSARKSRFLASLGMTPVLLIAKLRLEALFAAALVLVGPQLL
jgi:hypothetical protein